MVHKLLAILVALASFGIFAQTTYAVSRTEDVQLEVPPTTLTVQGKASPGALVAIHELSSTIGTVTADSQGNFSTVLTLSPGIHNISTFYNDTSSLRSVTNTKSLSLQPQQNKNHDIFLSPTIERSTPSTVQNGSIVQIRGYSYAGATVKLAVDINRFTESVIADSQGFYQFLVDSSVLGDGNHSVTTKSTLGSQVSDTSRAVNFVVQSVSGPIVPDIVVSPDQLPPPVVESPNDGAVIEGDRVTVSGESIPNAQINIYENGELYGSIVADSSGKWSFVYVATSTPVTLSFEACINGRCSVLSPSITLHFSSIGKCETNFTLERYRFWGIGAGELITQSVRESTGDGVILVNWGDGTEERFDHDSVNPRDIRKSYSGRGQYNGTARFVQDDCERVRYFSVHIVNNSADIPMSRLFWLFTLVASLYLLNQYYSRSDKK